MTSVVNDFDSPKHIIETQRPAVPVSKTGFRPTRSESRDQCMTKSVSVAKKSDSWTVSL